MDGKTRYVILGLLSDQPLTGYAIKKLIDVRFRFFWSESYGQIYPTLKKMLNQGYITIYKSDLSIRSQQRYAITELGQKALKDWVNESPDKESIRLEILLKMYFSSHGDKSSIIHHITEFKQTHSQDLMILNLFQNELKSIPDPNQNHQDILRVIDFGIKTNQAYLDWCKETIHYLEEKHS